MTDYTPLALIGGQIKAIPDADSIKISRISKETGTLFIQALTGPIRLQGNNIEVYDESTQIFNLSHSAGVSILSGTGLGATEINSATASVRLRSSSSGTIQFFEGSTGIFTIYDNAGISTILSQGSSGLSIDTAAGNLSLNAPAGSYVAIQENLTDVVRIEDQTNVSVISGRGTTATRLESTTGPLRLQCPTGSTIQLMEGSSTNVFNVSDETNVSTLAGQGSGGTRLSAALSNLMLNAPTGSYVALQENSTDVLRVSDESNISTVQGQGTSGARFSSSGNNVFLSSGSASFSVFIQAGTSTNMCQIAAVGTQTFLDLTGSTGNVLRHGGISGPLTIRGLSGSYVSIEEGTTEVFRISDTSNVSTLAAQGTAGLEISSPSNTPINITAGTGAAGVINLKNGSTIVLELQLSSNTTYFTGHGTSGTVVRSNTGNLGLSAPSGSYVAIQENAVDVIRVSDTTGTSVIEGQGAGGLNISAVSNLALLSGSGSIIQLFEGSTEIAQISDTSNVSTISLRGSSGGNIATNTGNLNLTAASGGVINLKEGSEQIIAVSSTSANTNRIDYSGSTSFIHSHNGPATYNSSNSIDFEVSSGQSRMSLRSDDSNYYTAGDNADTLAPTAYHQFNWNGTGGQRNHKWHYATTQTTDNTPKDLLTMSVSNTQVAHCHAFVTGYASSTNAASYERIATVRASGGTTALIGSVSASHTAEDTAEWDATIVVSGDDVIVRVTGSNAVTIRWEVHLFVGYGSA